MTNCCRCMQYFSAAAASILLANTAMYMRWYAASFFNLFIGNTPLGLIKSDDINKIYWILILGAAVGAVLSGFIVDKIGRKMSMLLCAILLFVPWIITAFAKSVTFLVIGRFIAGMACSLTVVATVSYNGEIADKDNRGKLGLIYSIAIVFGNIFMQGLAPSVTYRNLALSCCAFPLLFALLFFFMPESPYYLVKIGQRDAAQKNLSRLSNQRLEEIEESVTYDIQNSATLKGYAAKGLLVMLGITTLQEVSGSILLNEYGYSIILSNNLAMTQRVSQIIYGSLQIISYLVAVALVDMIGRKRLLQISAFGCTIILTAEAIYVLCATEYLVGLATAFLVIHVMLNSIGAYSLRYVLMGELFAINNKGVILAVITFYQVVANYLISRFFTSFIANFSSHIFWLSAGFCLLGGIFVIPALPETKGKTFMEIRHLYSDKQSNNATSVAVKPQLTLQA